ncbi:MAG TPA: thiamine ABC transporter substrate-binding protein [Candidatus Thermoplasmatota archaeon]|nr:thiamine ABC transporter substrate-binding protein [Candidatus Thermoplasmatota archaeon]
MKTRSPLLALTLLALALAGCSKEDGDATTYAEMGFDGETWPDLHGAKVTILGPDFTYLFDAAKPLFEQLTNGTVEFVDGGDSGDVLQKAIAQKENPSFDVVFGIDNALLGKAVAGGAFQPYTPVLAHRLDPRLVFFDASQPWPATPVDHGYIAVNIDPRANHTIEDFYDLREHADLFVTENPRHSTPGLGFLLATIATFGENTNLYDWKDYWNDLLDHGGFLVVDGWTDAYANHFSGGYGQTIEGSLLDRPIVTSYTTSPAYEASGGGTYNSVLIAPESTFHQIETMAIAANARELAAAQAWVEFTLTDSYQDLIAANWVVYPAVPGAESESVFLGLDPPPGSFVDTGFDYPTLEANVERWVGEWEDLYQAHQAQG